MSEIKLSKYNTWTNKLFFWKQDRRSHSKKSDSKLILLVMRTMTIEELQRTFDPFKINIPITWKPVSWYAEQINWLISIWWKNWPDRVNKKDTNKRNLYREKWLPWHIAKLLHEYLWWSQFFSKMGDLCHNYNLPGRSTEIKWLNLCKEYRKIKETAKCLGTKRSIQEYRDIRHVKSNEWFLWKENR